ncbi:hypothetical protein [Nocardia alba]|nr:hypothetical protein [Nocardia alba]
MTEALNAADADSVNALTCRENREKKPATVHGLRESLDAYGTYRTKIKNINIDGGNAAVLVNIKASKDKEEGTMEVDYVLEDGSWKRCDR